MNTKEAIEHLLKGEKIGNIGFGDYYYYIYNDLLIDSDGEPVGWDVFDEYDECWTSYEKEESNRLIKQIEEKVQQLKEIGYDYCFYKNECVNDRIRPAELEVEPEIKTHRDILLLLIEGFKIRQKGMAGMYYLKDGTLFFEYDSIGRTSWDVLDLDAECFEVAK